MSWFKSSVCVAAVAVAQGVFAGATYDAVSQPGDLIVTVDADGFDLSLIAFKGEVSLGQTIYDFSKDEIPAKSSEFELILTNNTKTDQMFNLYFVLER